MAFNYYEGWTEQELLAERKTVQMQLSSGRLTEVRLAGELTRNDQSSAATPLEMTLERIAYALYVLYAAGKIRGGATYTNPYAYQPGVTIQQRY